MHKQRLAVAFTISFALTAAGCGGDSKVTLDDLCNADDGGFIQVIEKQLDCNPEFLALFFGPRPTSAEIQTACEDSFAAYIESGTAELGSTKALDACLAAVAAASCDTYNLDNIPECNDVLTGTIAVGDECEADEQCSGDSYCDESGAACGVCVTRKPDAASCGDDSECASRHCSGLDEASMGSCRTPGGSGDACTESDDCSGRLVCNETTGMCQTPESWQVGDNCTPNTDDCAVIFTNLYCDTASSTCQAFAQVGDTCGPALPPCNLFKRELCDEATTQCAEAVEVGSGESCSLASGQICQGDLVCNELNLNLGTCQSPAQVGDSCDEDAQFPCPGAVLMECIKGMCQYGEYEGICGLEG